MRGRVLRIVGLAGSAGMLLACGGSGGGATSPADPGAPSTTTAPAPVTAPTPTPTPVATPTPTPTPTQQVPVAKVVIKIEFIDCPATGEVNQGGPYNWTSVGCRIHMDLNAKDRYNKPVQGKGDPEWHVDDPSLVFVRGDRSYTPVLVAQKTGKLLIQGEQDGVKSNTIQIWLY
jgi:hypothetical protein